MNFPNYEKLKSFVETFATYNQILFIKEQLWMSSARNYRPSFRENKPKNARFQWLNTSVLSLFSRKRGSINSGSVWIFIFDIGQAQINSVHDAPSVICHNTPKIQSYKKDDCLGS